MEGILTATPRRELCRGCGRPIDLPWGYCADCTGALLDAGRDVAFRLNGPEVLNAQFEKIRAYNEQPETTMIRLRNNLSHAVHLAYPGSRYTLCGRDWILANGDWKREGHDDYHYEVTDEASTCQTCHTEFDRSVR